MRTIKLLLVMLASLIVVACGGGGGGSGGNAGGSNTSGTATQYFTKNAVGNTWTGKMITTSTSAGSAVSTMTETRAITQTAFTGGVATFSITSTLDGAPQPASTGTVQVDSGALVATSGVDTTLMLPATFSVGTTWIEKPTDPAMGVGATNSKIAAFNVTRTTPAGTFTDCLQVDWTSSSTQGGVIITKIGTYYISASTGWIAIDASESLSGSDGRTGTFSSQLQAGYIANP